MVWEEGQKEGRVVNHLQTMHYHLGLICANCLNFFTTSSDTMWQHTLVCKSMATSDRNGNKEESPPEYEGDDNGDDDFKFGFDKD